jgi:hypothetical protein
MGVLMSESNDILDRETERHMRKLADYESFRQRVRRRFMRPDASLYADILRLWEVPVIKPEPNEIFDKLYGDLTGA